MKKEIYCRKKSTYFLTNKIKGKTLLLH